MATVKPINPPSLDRRRLVLRAAQLLAVCAALCACGGDDGANDVPVYASLDSIQCGAVGSPVSSLRAKLTTAGIAVASSSCGIDGMAHGAVCGASDGSIGIFNVAAAQVPGATALGFAPLSQLPAASVAACPAGGA